MDTSAENKVDILNEDLYALLGVEPDATVHEIKRAWRRCSRNYHPDINDTPDAISLFLKITKARDILTDETQRKNYDAKLKARLMHEKRKRELDSTTKQFRDSLIERERLHKKQKKDEEQEKINLQQQISQLKEEGIRKMKEQLLTKNKRDNDEPVTEPDNAREKQRQGGQESTRKADLRKHNRSQNKERKKIHVK